MLFQNLDLSLKHELLALDLEGLLLEVLDLPGEVTVHLSVLGLQQTDVLMGRLVIVVQAANARLLFVFNDFLSQNFELKLHEVNLLLQVDDVLVSGIHVGVAAELAWLLLALLLASEVHRRGRVVASTAAVRPASSEIGSAFHSASAFNVERKMEKLEFKFEPGPCQGEVLE